MSVTPPWQMLEWDSRFFGFGVGRLHDAPRTEVHAQAIREQARAQGVRLLYAVCDPRDAMACAALANVGGFLADLKRTYTAPVLAAAEPPVGVPLTVLPAQPAACERRQLRSLAWQAAVHSRFRVDPRMPHGAWRRMYSAWIARSLDGTLADRVIAARDGDTLTAMVTVSLRGPNASIGLLAVADRWRGRGLGRRLVQFAFDAARESGLPGLTVVTQGGNGAACRTYEGCGMAVSEEQCIIHLWTDR